MKIKTYKTQRVEVDEFEIPIPTETVYYFETGIRRSIRIVPEYTTWNKEQYNKDEELFRLHVTCVYQSYQCKIEKFVINIHEIEGIYNSTQNTNNKSVVELLVNNWGNKRTKEQFESDLEAVIKEINTL